MKISKKRQYQIDLNKELTKLVYQEVYMDDLSHEEQLIMANIKAQEEIKLSTVQTCTYIEKIYTRYIEETFKTLLKKYYDIIRQITKKKVLESYG